MPRSKDQYPLTFMVKKGLLDAINRACEASGHSDRSQFIRDALFDAMERIGMHLSPSIKSPPSRQGKGGRPRPTL